MADIPEVEGNSPMEILIGLFVVILATFLGICNVKDGNIVQAMQLRQADRNDNWAWFQARNIRATIYESMADELAMPRANETPEFAKLREEKAEYFRKRFKDQETKAEKQMEAAKLAEEDYKNLNAKDDQFDLSEAALAIGLAMMGVTALVKRWWLFIFALIPSLFGLGMGIAGFMGVDTNTPFVAWIIQVLS